ncbi:uncharacterized protein BCR38DRAFT_412471 [Pseudomassariella vexata]|uniref:Uncharacterized protein n=1 Tax=Pseudomassariella vexata TaxID=1141098 RepID=A0A1Y2DJQ4_9PEZI|nr:uncharacterized protein BCR38DRAFT_412471 [Pseudomassariella vexata]ORY59451.1 hypothetical protein BCR38DRAFT_412471 [Pseudomassariella vexata]
MEDGPTPTSFSAFKNWLSGVVWNAWSFFVHSKDPRDLHTPGTPYPAACGGQWAFHSTIDNVIVSLEAECVDRYLLAGDRDPSLVAQLNGIARDAVIMPLDGIADLEFGAVTEKRRFAGTEWGYCWANVICDGAKTIFASHRTIFRLHLRQPRLDTRGRPSSLEHANADPSYGCHAFFTRHAARSMVVLKTTITKTYTEAQPKGPSSWLPSVGSTPLRSRVVAEQGGLSACAFWGLPSTLAYHSDTMSSLSCSAMAAVVCSMTWTDRGTELGTPSQPSGSIGLALP